MNLATQFMNLTYEPGDIIYDPNNSSNLFYSFILDNLGNCANVLGPFEVRLELCKAREVLF